MRRLGVFAALLTASVLGAEDRKTPTDGPKAFQGEWTITEMQRGKAGPQQVSAPIVVFEGSKYRISDGAQTIEEGTFRADATKTPNRIKVTATAGEDKGKSWHGIYELEGNTLRAVVGPTDAAAPTTLTKPQPGQRAFNLKRKKSAG